MAKLSVLIVFLFLGGALVGGCEWLDSATTEEREENQARWNSDDADGDRSGDGDSADGGDRDADADADADADGDSDGDQTQPDPYPEDVPARVHGLITDRDFQRLVIEVDYVEGRQPRTGSTSRLVAGIESLVDKPAGVEVVVDEAIAVSEPEGGWTFARLQELVRDHQNLAVEDGTIRVYTVFVDGHYADSEGTVLGIAWGHQYIVMFRDRIEAACRSMGLLPTMEEQLCENAELTVWRHEMGHVLGLVNNGAPLTSAHEDAQRQRHCSSEQCVMYWAFRGPSMMDRLVDGLLGGNASAPDFDAACRADLEAVRP